MQRILLTNCLFKFLVKMVIFPVCSYSRVFTFIQISGGSILDFQILSTLYLSSTTFAMLPTDFHQSFWKCKWFWDQQQFASNWPNQFWLIMAIHLQALFFPPKNYVNFFLISTIGRPEQKEFLVIMLVMRCLLKRWQVLLNKFSTPIIEEGCQYLDLRQF